MKWPAWHTALWVAHNPTSVEDLAPETPARRRLAYDELLANQLALGLVRAAAAPACRAPQFAAMAGCGAGCWTPCPIS